MKTINYNKTCPNCNGSPYTLKEGEKISFLFKKPDTMIICNKCRGTGAIQPKQVIHKPDRFKPVIIW